MHEHVKEIAARPSKRWHIHIFEKEKRGAPISAIPETELLARLEGRTPVVPPKVTLGLRLAALEGLVRSDISISAMKTTAAVCDCFHLRSNLAWNLNAVNAVGYYFCSDLARSVVSAILCAVHTHGRSSERHWYAHHSHIAPDRCVADNLCYHSGNVTEHR